MDINFVKSELQKSFNQQVMIEQKRPNLYQILLPLFHPDGDMIDLFISPNSDETFTLTDCGLTLMRLSYTFDLDTEHRMDIFKRLLIQHDAGFEEETGSITLMCGINQLFNTIMHYSQIVSQISSLKILQRKTVASLFYDDVKAFIDSEMGRFKVEENYHPIKNDEDLVVDYAFVGKTRSVYVFPVKGTTKTQSAIITILRLQKDLGAPFVSVLLHDDYESLTKADRRISMKVADKQFSDLNSFKESANEFITRALA